MLRFFLSLLLAATIVEAQRAGDANAVNVWEKVLAAKAGIERLHGIESVLRSSHHAEKIKGRSCQQCQSEELFVLPNRFWHWFDTRPTVLDVSAAAVNLETGHRYYASRELTSESVTSPLQEGWRPELLQAAELLETRWMHLQPVRTWMEKRNKETNILIECRFPMSVGFATSTFTIDSSTLLPTQVLINRPLNNGQVAKLGYAFLDYVNVDGIEMPSRIRHFGDDLKYEEMVRYRFNVDYDSKIFERVPRLRDGPEGWRKQSPGTELK